MGRRPLVAMALGWVLVVAVVGAVTFVVVVNAGREVGQASAARTVAALPTPPASPTRSTDTAATSTPPAPATATPTPTRTGPPPPTRTTRPPAPGSSPAVRPAEARTVSFTTDGGTVVASCAGTALTLDAITPRDGWRFEDDVEHGALEVKFKPRAEGVDEVEIKIACVRGTPTRLGD